MPLSIVAFLAFPSLLLAFSLPIQSYLGLTSNFGEYRPTHLHGGIDFSTGGKTGVPVFAFEKGEVWQVSVTFRGYGKALYLRHPNKMVTVYAHLERFRSDIEKAMVPFISKKNPYPGKIRLPHPIFVKKGELIGFSGESGAGRPHLHFEIRQENQPQNPLDYLPIPDKAFPVFQNLQVVPASPQAEIDGLPFSRMYPPHHPHPIIVKGPFKLAFQAYQKLKNHRSNLLSWQVTLDGKLLSSCNLQSFSYEIYRGVAFFYRRSQTKLSKPSFTYWITPPEENPLPFLKGPSVIKLSPGKHVLGIHLGKVTVSYNLKVLPSPKSLPRSSGQEVFITHLFFNKPYPFPLKPKPIQKGVAYQLPPNQSWRFGVVALQHGEPKPLKLYIRKEAYLPPCHGRFKSPLYRIEPYDIPWRQGIKLHWTPSSKVSKAGWYSWDGKKWYPVGQVLSVPDPFAYIVDEQPPQVTLIKKTKTTYTLHVKDELSGMDWDSVFLVKEKKKVLCSYDPDYNQAQCPKLKGMKRLQVCDKENNCTTLRLP